VISVNGECDESRVTRDRDSRHASERDGDLASLFARAVLLFTLSHNAQGTFRQRRPPNGLLTASSARPGPRGAGCILLIDAKSAARNARASAAEEY